MRSILLLALLGACNPDVSVVKQSRDADHDGHDTEVDCDDAHASVNPDAEEVCDGIDDDCDGAIDEDATDGASWFADADGDGAGDDGQEVTACDAPDGYVATGGDCDDAEPVAFPGNIEVCDGVDNDCDGDVDGDATDAPTRYADADGDGYGDATTGFVSCEDPGGYVLDDTDCDDACADVHPDADEQNCEDPTDYDCDGSVSYADADGDGTPACRDCDDTDPGRSPALAEVCDAADTDEDCDGLADGADDDATGTTSWSADADGDTYGDPVATLSACDAPGGYVADATDCDDAASGVNPAATEVCDPADTDEDCDGLADDADPSVTGGSTAYVDADGDRYGAGAATTACDLGAGYEADASDCDDADAGVNPGAAEVCGDGVDDDCDGADDTCGPSGSYTASDAEAVIYGDAAGDALTASGGLSGAGDLNADGYDDVVVGAYAADGGVAGSGEAYVFYGPITGSNAASTGDSVIAGASASDQFGGPVLGGYDWNGDGFDDIAVAAPYDDDGGTDGGRVGVWYGPLSATETSGTADVYLYGLYSSMHLGSVMVGADWDGDGDDDLVVMQSGAAVAFRAPFTASPYAVGSSGGWFGTDALDGFAFGDVDGDGYDDLVAGQDTNYGTVYVLESTRSLASSMLNNDADHLLSSTSASDRFGATVASGCDLDADGYDDVVVGAPSYGSGAGAVYVFSGSMSRTVYTSTGADMKITGEAGSQLGSALDAGRDVDGDGADDLLAGATYAGTADEGAAYLFYGTLAGTLTYGDASASFSGDAASDALGGTVRFAGDVDGDGVEDLWLGAAGADDGGSGSGAAYLFIGG